MGVLVNDIRKGKICMAKFAIECPVCGKYAEAKQDSFHEKRLGVPVATSLMCARTTCHHGSAHIVVNKSCLTRRKVSTPRALSVMLE